MKIPHPALRATFSRREKDYARLSLPKPAEAG